MPRTTLSDLTNTSFRNSLTNRKRSYTEAEVQNEVLKSQCKSGRVPAQETRSDELNTHHNSISSDFSHPRRASQLRRSRQSRLAIELLGTQPMSTRPVLESFSLGEADVHSFDGGKPNLPFTALYSNASRLGKAQLLAVATPGAPGGNIHFFDTKRYDTGAEWRASNFIHASDVDQVLDLQWRRDDKQIAAALDTSVTIYDVTSHTSIGVYQGHTAGVKSLAWDPKNESIFASAGRDGNICIWDARLSTSQTQTPNATPVLFIKQAHNPAARRKRNFPNSTSKSVTSVVYLPDSPQIVSSGAGDGILMKWDLRHPHSQQAQTSHPTRLTKPVDETVEDPTLAYTASARARGITCLSLSVDGRMVFGLGTDGYPYTYMTQDLRALPPMPCLSPTKSSGSSIPFSSKMSASLCGRWLATTGREGSTCIYELSRGGGVLGEPVVLRENENEGGRRTREVAGVSWAGDSTLAICESDYTLRVWRRDGR